VHRPWRPGGEGGGAATGPLAGARSPAGERTAVERLSGGARTRAVVGPDALHASVRAVRAQGGTGGGGDGEVGVHTYIPFRVLCVLDLGLALGFRNFICLFDSRSSLSPFHLPEARSTT
jgi:hypothetical protein